MKIGMKMIDFLRIILPKFEEAFKKALGEANKELKKHIEKNNLQQIV